VPAQPFEAVHDSANVEFQLSVALPPAGRRSALALSES
jgi:hypothetical protein